MRTAVLLCSAAVMTMLMTGCYATTRLEGGVVYEEPLVSVETVPVHIETYPRVHYRGNYAYLVEGRWYYATGHGWAVFRQEPEVLGRYRVRYHRTHPQRVHRHHEAATPPPRYHRSRHRYYSD